MNKPYKEIDTLLREQVFSGKEVYEDIVYQYAESLAEIEKSIVVVSDLKSGTSRIFPGAFSATLGLGDYSSENSIWEKEILCRLPPEEMNAKYLGELRFYNALRRIPRSKRENHYLAAHLRMKDATDKLTDVLHRMYYRLEPGSDAIRFGICTYGPLVLNLPAKSIAIDAITGHWEELSPDIDKDILSAREKQVLTLIERGLTSHAIAEQLCISKNTVSRHRQEILKKLQVKNSTEACLRAKLLRII